MQLFSKRYAGGKSLNFTGTVMDHVNVRLVGDDEGNLFINEKVVTDEVDADGNSIYVSEANYDIPDDLANEILADAQLGDIVFPAVVGAVAVAGTDSEEE